MRPIWVIDGEDLANRPWHEHLEQVPSDAHTPGRWLAALDLRPGDLLLLRDQLSERIESIDRPYLAARLYNFSVENNRCYAVGQRQILVHNTKPINWSGGELPEGKKPPSNIQANRTAGDAIRNEIAAREAPALIERTLTTIGGIRRIDVLKIGDELVAIESEVGTVFLDSRIRQELARDWWLLREGQIDRVIWEFTRSRAIGKSGPSPELINKLHKLGVGVVIST